MSKADHAAGQSPRSSQQVPGQTAPPDASATLWQLAGVSDPAGQSREQMLAHIAADAPAIYRLATLPSLSEQARVNVSAFLSSAFSSSARYQSLIRDSSSFPQAAELFETSLYLSELLVRDPQEFGAAGELSRAPAGVRSGYLFEHARAEWEGAEDPVFAYIASSPAETAEKSDLLRRHFRHCTFREGCRDLFELRPVYASLAAISAAAGHAVEAALALAGTSGGLSVLALGRLATHELDVLSDVDLLLVCEEDADRSAVAKSAERLLDFLAAYTKEGSVFPVDLRLRPRGTQGELVVTPAQLKAYFQNEAEAWEALAYTKLRYLAGSRRGAQGAMSAAEVLFARYAGRGSFLSEVKQMRTRLERAGVVAKSFKASEGGVFDIDFLAAYLLVKHEVPQKGGSLRDRLWRCSACGALEKSEAALLDHAAELLRTVDHVVRLVTAHAGTWLPAGGHRREKVEELSAAILGRRFPHGVEPELIATMKRVHDLYRKLTAG